MVQVKIHQRLEIVQIRQQQMLTLNQIYNNKQLMAHRQQLER